jgi:hypothetical protein
MGGSTTLGLCPGDWPKAVWACTKHPDKTMKAIASRRELSFLFIYDFFYGFLKMNVFNVLFSPAIHKAKWGNSLNSFGRVSLVREASSITNVSITLIKRQFHFTGNQRLCKAWIFPVRAPRFCLLTLHLLSGPLRLSSACSALNNAREK